MSCGPTALKAESEPESGLGGSRVCPAACGTDISQPDGGRCKGCCLAISDSAACAWAAGAEPLWGACCG